jgi:hypothetical protein
MDSSMTRRRFFSTTALAGTGSLAAALLAGRTASAFSVAPKNAEAERLYAEACSLKDGPYHRQLVADIKQRLQGRATDAQIEEAIAQTTCPICGCPITAG